MIYDTTVAKSYKKVICLNRNLLTKMKVENIQSQLKRHNTTLYNFLLLMWCRPEGTNYIHRGKADVNIGISG